MHVHTSSTPDAQDSFSSSGNLPAELNPFNKRGYQLVALSHLVQVVLAMLKSGISIATLHHTTGPLLSAVWIWMLGNSVQRKNGCLPASDIVFLELHGVLLLYATLCLAIIAVVPQVHSLFTCLWLGSSLSTLLLALRGTFPVDQNGASVPSVAKYSSRLSKRAFRVSSDVPRGGLSLTYALILLAVATLKARILFQLVQHLLTPTASKVVMARQLSEFARLSMIGGTTVTLRDAMQRNITSRPAFVQLNLGVAYALLLTLAKHVMPAQ